MSLASPGALGARNKMWKWSRGAQATVQRERAVETQGQGPNKSRAGTQQMSAEYIFAEKPT